MGIRVRDEVSVQLMLHGQVIVSYKADDKVNTELSEKVG